MGNSNGYVLEMRSICKAFPGVQALDHVNLFIKPGEVHALVGENGAGKSTLMNILTGSYSLDQGEVFLRGEPVNFTAPIQSMLAGISMIHQELTLVPQMSAVQNMFLGSKRATRLLGILDGRQRRAMATETFGRLNMDFDLDTPVQELSVAYQQMIEIAKALLTRADIVVMDEPTSSLTEREIDTLYKVIRSLQEQGVALIYISHRLEEIFDLADQVTVLRDGKNVGTEPIDALDMDDVVRMMVGRELKRFFTRHDADMASPDKAIKHINQHITSLFERHSDITGVFVSSDNLVDCVLDKIRALGVQHEVRVVSADGLAPALESVETGRLEACVAAFPRQLGAATCQAALRHLEGLDLESRISWPVHTLDCDSLGQFKDGIAADAAPAGTQDRVIPSRAYKIGVVLKEPGNPYWQAVEAGMRQGSLEFDISLDIRYPEEDADEGQQIELVDVLVEAGCDIICVAPMTDSCLMQMANALESRQVRLVVMDEAWVKHPSICTVIAPSQISVGEQAARCLARSLPAGSKVVILEHPYPSRTSALRRRGFCRAAGEVGLDVVDDRQVAVEVKNLSTEQKLRDVSFKAYWGEVFGIAGLVGSGRTEVARAIFGADPIDAGQVFVDSREVVIGSPGDAMRHGVGLVPEDRKHQGLVLDMAVGNNSTLAVLDQISNWGVLNENKRKELADRYVEKLNIKTPSLAQAVKYLSGGNQQKVVISKWMASRARILIFDEPTRGVDVGAKVEIRSLMNDLVKEGACVILISSELPEVLGLCDRVMVMSEGQVTGEFDVMATSEEEVMHFASGLNNDFVSSLNQI